MALKRSAEPLGDRAVRRVISLEASLRGMIALVDEAEERGETLSLAAMSLDGVTQLLGACRDAFATVPIARTETVATNDDVLRLIFQYYLSERSHANGRLAVRPIRTNFNSALRQLISERTLRLVCKRWAVVAGTFVRNLAAPAYKPGPINLAAAFPFVTHISTGRRQLKIESHHAQFQNVLASYAPLGTLVCVDDRREKKMGTTLRKLDLCRTLFIDGYCDANRGKPNFVWAALKARAWPIQLDRTLLYAQLRDDDPPEHAGPALVRAHFVEFKAFRGTGTGKGLFGAKTICFNLTWASPVDAGISTFSLEAIGELLQPARWVDGALPAVRVIASSCFPHVSRCVEIVRHVRALVPPDSVRVCAKHVHLYESFGFPVAEIDPPKK